MKKNILKKIKHTTPEISENEIKQMFDKLIERFDKVDNNLDKIFQDVKLSTIDFNVDSNGNNRIKNYYNVVLRHINCFLNKMSVFMVDPTNLIDITNLDSTSADIRNDMLILNYFKPVIEFYDATN